MADGSGWFDQKKNIDLVIKITLGLAALTVVVDLLSVAHVWHKHGHYNWETWPGFHGIYAFVSYVGLVLVATQFRKLVMRDEDYYGEGDSLKPDDGETGDHGEDGHA